MQIKITQYNKDGDKIQSWTGDTIGTKMSLGLQNGFLQACEVGDRTEGDYFKLRIIDEDDN